MNFLGYTAMIRLDNVSATVTPSADRVIGSLAQADRASCNAVLQEKYTGKHRMGSNESCSEVACSDVRSSLSQTYNKDCDIESTPSICCWKIGTNHQRDENPKH